VTRSELDALQTSLADAGAPFGGCGSADPKAPDCAVDGYWVRRDPPPGLRLLVDNLTCSGPPRANALKAFFDAQLGALDRSKRCGN
jgi:hypothetical protein